jgi:DNA-binding PadR family transcriptional regulator
MSLRHAILGILNHSEMHGYQIKRVLEEGVSSFWPVKLAAIYPSLRTLEDAGLVAHRREATGEGRPDRKVYAITGPGREELAHWRRVPPDGGISVKNPLYLKLLFATDEEFPEATGWVGKELEQCRASLDQLRADLANPKAFSTFVVRFMRESGVAQLELRIELLEELRARLQQRIAHRDDDAEDPV